MEGRTEHNIGYRFGFQGQEEDEETDWVNYKYRMHNPVIGRFFAVDPLTAEYPFYSPYAFSGNRVIDAYELEGLEPVVENGQITGYTVQDGQGPTQIAKDINNPKTQAKYGYKLNGVVSWQQVVSNNLFAYSAGSSPDLDMNDMYADGWKSLNVNPGDALAIFTNERVESSGGFPLPGAGPYAKAAEEFGKKGKNLKKSTAKLKSTGKHKYYKNGWSGNQHIKTKHVFNNKLTKTLAKNAPGVGIILDLGEVAGGVLADTEANGGNITIGKNTMVETSGVAGSFVGGGAGAWAGAGIGSFIAPGIGTVIGGVIGGFAGSWGGEVGAEAATKSVIEN
jgi:RHS repeat-associated protein